MSGIYIHIPFCKQKCTYCDFYTVVAPGLVDETIKSIVKEIELRSGYLTDKNIKTIYFGGGTPSILDLGHFKSFFDKISEFYTIDENAEITLEANPDDLNDAFFLMLKELPFNRLSIGIQSFNDADLKFINRRHTAQEAINAVKKAQFHGFKNISVDLIYGLAGQDLISWEENVQKVIELNVQHISAYGLTFEEGTVLNKQKMKGIVKQIPDEIILTLQCL